MIELIMKLDSEFIKLESNENFQEVSSQYTSGASKELLEQASKLNFSEDFIMYYDNSNGYNAKWTIDDTKNLLGKINLIPLEHILGDWKGDIYMEGDSLLKDFCPIDMFSEEAHCGILKGETGKKRIYLHHYGEEELFDLQIDFKGYYELLTYTKGFFYWPMYILELINNKETSESKNFKKEMPKIFDNFSLELFNEKYQSIKI